MSTSCHTLAEERSIAMHAAIAARFADDPSVLASARTRVANWLAESPKSHHYARQWSEILNRPPKEIADFLGGRSDLHTALRSCSPFAGALDARERWKIHREVRQALEGQ